MHKLLIEETGKKMLMLGNEAIARGGIEAGVTVAAAYPGTPSSVAEAKEMTRQAFELVGN